MDPVKKPVQDRVQAIVRVPLLVIHVQVHVLVLAAQIVAQTALVVVKEGVQMHVAAVRGLVDKCVEAHAPITAIQVVGMLVAMLVRIRAN